MAQGKSTALDLIKAVSGQAGDTREALDMAKSKLGFLSEAGSQLKNLARDFRDLSAQERLIRVGGLVALATLGWIMKKEDAEYFEEGQDEIAEDETLEDTEPEKSHKKKKRKAEEKVKRGEMTEADKDAEFDPKEDEVISSQQCAVNMYAIRYFEKDGTKHANPNQLGKVLEAEKVTPSKFILEKSSALFKDGVGSFEDFKKNVTRKLVNKSVTDPQERIRQATVILSCCAVGRFQIVPHFFFGKMGLSMRGEKGLKDIYNFIRSTDRQVAMFKKIVEGQWETYKDVGLVAVAYYAGDGTAEAYKKEPGNSRFKTAQYGGHASIHDYAQRARGNFDKFKKEVPGLQDIDYVAMVIESNETGKGVIYARAKQGQGISGTQTAVA